MPEVPVTSYNSDDAETMNRHIDQARSAGIDALVLNWWGTGNRTNKNLKQLLDLAAQKNYRVAVDFDFRNSPVMHGVADYAANLQYLLSVHATHPAYLRVDGRPVVFFFNVSSLSVDTWRGIRQQVDPEGKSIWIAEGTDLAYLAVFDGHHLYSIAWRNQIPPEQILPKWGDRMRTYNRDHGTSKLWVATVMPGYDDRKVRPAGFSVARNGGDYYRRTWEQAIASAPDWVMITSFNEWPEGTYIEPSQAHGNLYLDLTRDGSTRYKAATFAASVAPVVPTPVPTLVPPPPPPQKPAPRWPLPGGETLPAGCGHALVVGRGDLHWEVSCHHGALEVRLPPLIR